MQIDDEIEKAEREILKLQGKTKDGFFHKKTEEQKQAVYAELEERLQNLERLKGIRDKINRMQEDKKEGKQVPRMV